jgi:aryl-phospho-beta-D-glucosidase BglC (GH1 family)
VLAEELGPARAEFFWERLLDHFFGDEDLAFLKKCGATVVRLPVNYRHFESDLAPLSYIERGFERLSRAIDMCERHGIYAIIDLHAVQGWQNTDWHCDNATRHSLFWRDAHCRERFVALWNEFARRFSGRAAVAGYNIMNEPLCNASRGRMGTPYASDWDLINGVFHQTVDAIRAVDPQHIVFIEGDHFSSLFEGLEPPFADNLVYSSHNYSGPGFGPGSYPGDTGDRDSLVRAFESHQGTQYARRHNVPLWVGEFGSVYNGPAEEIPDRLRALDDQIDTYEQGGAHWTTWTYKDVGVMGWVVLDPECEYLQLVKPVLEAKKELRTDFWMGWLPATEMSRISDELAAYVEKTVGDPQVRARDFKRYLMQALCSGFLGSLLQAPYARRFKGMSEERLDQVLQSFSFSNCRVNQGLIDVVSRHMARPA